LSSDPHVVVWTDHALVKAQVLGVPRVELEDALLSSHARRVRNTRAADWLLTIGRLEVAYNHPDEGDDVTARIVTIWRRD
jgi:hypothetical protein